MKILITGAAGAIGSHLVERLLKEGHQVIGIDCLTDYYDKKIKEHTKLLLENAGCTFFTYNLVTDDISKAIENVEIIFHFAAQPGISSSVPFDTFVVNNITATQRLLEAIKKSPSLKLFVNISTSSVYGAKADGDETSLPQPTSPYGVTKLAAEQLALSYYREYGLPVTSLRLFSVYGERERPEKLFHKLTKAIVEHTPFPLYEGAENHRRSYTYVGDIIEACMLVIGNVDSVKGEIINIGNDNVVTTGEGIAVIEKTLGVTAQIEKLPPRVGDQLETSANITKARKLLGYNPTVSIEEGLPKEVLWYKENFPSA